MTDFSGSFSPLPVNGNLRDSRAPIVTRRPVGLPVPIERDHTRFRPATSHPEIATFHVSDKAIRFAIKPGVFALSLIPVFLSAWDALQHRPTNPYDAIVRST